MAAGGMQLGKDEVETLIPAVTGFRESLQGTLRMKRNSGS